MGCKAALDRAGLQWKQFSINAFGSLSDKERRDLSWQCVTHDEVERHVLLELNFYPTLYFKEDTVKSGTCPKHDSSVEEGTCGQFLRRHGEVRHLATEGANKASLFLPTMLSLGLCVNPACISDDMPTDYIVPLWLGLNLQVSRQAGCCTRAIRRYEWSAVGLQVVKLSMRDRQWYTLHRFAVAKRDQKCVLDFHANQLYFGKLFGAPISARILLDRGFAGLHNLIVEPGGDDMQKQADEEYLQCTEAGHRYVSVNEADAKRVTLKHYGMCVPQSCDDQMIFDSLMASQLQITYQGKRPFLAVEEAFPWSAIAIDFILVGFAKCGTSSIAASLDQHPRIAVASCSANIVCEHALFTHLHRDFLLTRSAIYSAKSSFASGPATIHGLKDPGIIEHDLSILRVGTIPRVRVIIVIRDPIDALESLYNTNECWRIADISDIALRGIIDCLDGGMGPQSGRSWSQRVMFAMSILPFGSLYLVHMEMLFASGERQLKEYNNLLQFLGVPKSELFGSDHIFAARNLRTEGPRVLNLCAPKNRKILQLLKLQYAEEYAMLKECLIMFGAAVPRSFSLRMTRCDTDEFIVHVGKHCNGMEPDLLRGYRGSAGQCKDMCLQLGGRCVGFLRHHVGQFTGRCYFRSGVLSTPEAAPTNRSCYERVFRDQGDV